MANLVVDVLFNGNTEEAMHFYGKCLGGTVNINYLSEFIGEDVLKPEEKDLVAVASLTNSFLTINGSDAVGSEKEKYLVGNNIRLNLNCEDAETAKKYFSALSEGGVIQSALQEDFMGVRGVLTDKYGLKWMIRYIFRPTPNTQNDNTN